MRLRTLGGIDSASGPVFDGISENKVKMFLMADLISLYVYNKYAINHYFKEINDKNKSIDDAIAVSRNLALRYYGSTSGTPANQLNKRVRRMIFILHGMEVGDDKDDANIACYRETMNPDSQKPQLSVKIECDSMGSLCTDERRLDMLELCNYIKEHVLVPATSDLRMQSVVKLQYDLMHETFKTDRNLSEDVQMDIIRFYLSLSCILHGPMRRVGKEYEPSFNPESFYPILPIFQKPVLTERLLVISTDVNTPQLEDLDDVFKNIRVVRGYIDRWDLEISIYKARVDLEFNKYNLLVMGNAIDNDTMVSIFDIVDKISWQPVNTLVVSGCRVRELRNPPQIITPTVETDILREIRCFYINGISENECRTHSIIKSSYVDLFSIRHPGIREMTGDGEITCHDVIRCMNALIDEVGEVSDYPKVFLDSIDCMIAGLKPDLT